MDSIECAKSRIREIIADSKVPEDIPHAENTLKWLMKLDPTADQALQIASLAHDIDRAVEELKVLRSDYDDYDLFKEAHARNGAKILRAILNKCGIAESIADEACRLVTLHEIGGDPRSNTLKYADSISFFDINLSMYYQREGWEETKRRCIWGYLRLSAHMRKIVKDMRYENDELTCLLNEAVREANLKI